MTRYSYICVLAKIVLKLLFRIHVKGLGNIPRTGSFIIAANHISFLDPVAVGAFIPRSLHYMGRDSLFDIFILGWVLRMCQAFPVRRDNPHPGTIKKALSILRSGSGLLLFPEGTRSVDGKLQKGGPGLGMLALLARAPIIPTVIMGTEKALPVDARWIRLEKVQVDFGKPLAPPPLEENKKRRQLYQAVTDEVMRRIKDSQKTMGT